MFQTYTGILNVSLLVLQHLEIQKTNLLKRKNVVNMSYYFHGDARKKCNPSYTICFILSLSIFLMYAIYLYHFNGASIFILKRNIVDIDNIVINALITQVIAKLFDVKIVFKKFLKYRIHLCM